jgi:hypothetical protein
MKHYFFLVCLAVLSGCSTQTELEDNPKRPTQATNELQLDFDQRAKREIESKLQIPRNEKYSYTVYKEYINADSIQDAIITVNRMQFAMDEAIRSGHQAKMAELGFMGNYNFFIYYDGATDQFSVPLPVPSTPGRPLDVSFQSIVSPTRKDIVIDYRIRNSGWRSYFSVFNETDLALVFQWKMFDHVGEDHPEALLHATEDSKEYIGKDLLIYTSEIENYTKNIGDIYAYTPRIIKPLKLEYRFYFDAKYGKFRLYTTGPGSEHAKEFMKR